MNNFSTDMREIARENAPAAMPDRLRLELLRTMAHEESALRADSALPGNVRERMLQAMEQESAELQADAALERELRSVFAAAPMAGDLRKSLPVAMQAAGTRAPRIYVRRLAGAAAVVVLMAGLLIHYIPTAKQPVGAAQVQMTRQVTPVGTGSVRCDTFVMVSPDRSRLVIRVQEPVKSQLPDEVI
ncbi:MAG: hypothetical protein IJ503_08225 [Akkermansia sp.]|nr:hypothetical protein [Akkermansia sp.]